VGDDAHQRGDAITVKQGLHPLPVWNVHLLARVIQPYIIDHITASASSFVFAMIHQSAEPCKRWRSFLCGNTAENVQKIKILEDFVANSPRRIYTVAGKNLGNTAQYVCGIFRKICALILSLFLEVHNTTHFVRMHKFALPKSKIWTLS
jgi:hypothetical protein